MRRQTATIPCSTYSPSGSAQPTVAKDHNLCSQMVHAVSVVSLKKDADKAPQNQHKYFFHKYNLETNKQTKYITFVLCNTSDVKHPAAEKIIMR